jgi:hypothetical protein
MQIEILSFHHWGKSLCEHYYAMNRVLVEGADKVKIEIKMSFAADLRRGTQIKSFSRECTRKYANYYVLRSSSFAQSRS